MQVPGHDAAAVFATSRPRATIQSACLRTSQEEVSWYCYDPGTNFLMLSVYGIRSGATLFSS